MSDLDVRFADHLRASAWLDDASEVVIGVSGGMDSMVLLHLMRFGDRVPPVSLHVAHVDHRMRKGSAEDAAWVAGICAEWEVPCGVHRAPGPITSEAAGRELRYRLFEEIRQGLGDGAVTMTAHTADDQAETVLFRAARGERDPGPGRNPARAVSVGGASASPLLAPGTGGIRSGTRDPVPRRPHEPGPALDPQPCPAPDPSPPLEEAVPGAAGALAALADTSRTHAAALDELLDARIAALAVGTDYERSDELSLDRNALCALSDPVLTLVMRRAVARLGGEAGRAATAALVRFVRESPSGRSVDVGGGAVVERHLAAVRIRGHELGSRPVPAPAGVQIDANGSGETVFARNAVGGGAVRVVWGPSPRPGFPHVAHIPRDRVPFPLVLRAWEPGDRVQMPFGRKKVKKLLLEARVPADRREHFPVLADAAGTILWIPGVTDPFARAEPSPGSRVCCVAVSFHDEP